MDLIINPGSPDDKQSIPLVTSKRRHIKNEQRPPKAPSRMLAAKRIFLDGHPERELRSLSSTYNCVGMVFANRRTCIEPDQVQTILDDDGYRQVSDAEVMPGDVVVYEKDNSISHVAMVLSKQPDLANGQWRIRVLSQWGADGEYSHWHDDVADLLGEPIKFYSERKA